MPFKKKIGFRDSQRRNQILEMLEAGVSLTDREERELKRIESGKPRRKRKAPAGSSPKGKERSTRSKAIGAALADIAQGKGERRNQSRTGGGGTRGGLGPREFDKLLGKFVKRGLLN